MYRDPSCELLWQRTHENYADKSHIFDRNPSNIQYVKSLPNAKRAARQRSRALKVRHHQRIPAIMHLTNESGSLFFISWEIAVQVQLLRVRQPLGPTKPRSAGSSPQLGRSRYALGPARHSSPVRYSGGALIPVSTRTFGPGATLGPNCGRPGLNVSKPSIGPCRRLGPVRSIGMDSSGAMSGGAASCGAGRTVPGRVRRRFLAKA